MIALRSSASARALRTLASLKGGADGLMIRLVETPVGASSQMALGACAVTSLSSGTVTSAEKVMSNSPATNARMRVERFSITFHSMAST